MSKLYQSYIEISLYRNKIANKRPKGPHIVHLSTMCHLFEESARATIFVSFSEEKSKMCQLIRGQCGHLVFPIRQKNTNLVEDVEILLPVKFC